MAKKDFAQVLITNFGLWTSEAKDHFTKSKVLEEAGTPKRVEKRFVDDAKGRRQICC